ncbi:MAG: MMPL family transporter [Paenibacillus dendritiformis]|uniref:MMPL family transporter n=1 Tax=uncultured Paenibacillus sp. TaxID=227322 RepID=UPI0025DF701D|nr:MMPL family transporter [uncultured Paenibacillus sp.]MDU5144587.1 MMPL family transporter [Paenibacillus dendritiformis]
MNLILKARWAIIAVWIIAAAGLMIVAPSLNDLVKEKGTITVPDGYSSTEAQAILDQAAARNGVKEQSQIALVFHNPDGLQADEIAEIKETIQRLEQHKADLGIESILNPYAQPELEKKLVSRDGKTVLTSIGVAAGGHSIDDTISRMHKDLESVKVEHYMTGRHSIDKDTIQSSQDGLMKSEYFTVAFILIILILVFRSFVAPLIPLLAVGVSYLISQSIVAFLVDSANFPVSTFTQIFMVAVMFGIGTDYCILLLSRFKEEVPRHEHIGDAIIATYRTAGKTVLFSGLAVLIGFTAIGLSTFILYRSAVAVAIGIAVMLIALVTIVPFFMFVFGTRIFWPSRNSSLEHKESRTWGAVGSFSLKRPWAALLIVAAVTIPFIATYNGQLSYNSLEEIGDKYDSVKAFNIIADSFEPGESLPAQIVVHSGKPIDTAEYMALAEKISREVDKVPGVASVRSLSRPSGEAIPDLKITEQAKTLKKGLGEGSQGLADIKSGLSQASSALSENAPKLKEAADSAGQLTTGTKALKEGIRELNAGLARIQEGIADGSTGAGQLKAGLSQAQASALQLAAANEKLLASYRKIGDGIQQADTGLKQMQQQLDGAAKALQSLDTRFGRLEENYPALLRDEDYLAIRGTVTETGQGTAQLAGALGELSGRFGPLAAGLRQANEGYAQAVAGQKALASGLDQLINGLSDLENGLTQAAHGQGQIIGKVPSVIEGLTRIEDGQQQMGDGFQQLNNQLTQLSDGLKLGIDGLEQVSGGLNSASHYLSEVGSTADSEFSGWFVPREVLENPDFRQAIDLYVSPDRTVMTLDVVFSVNPYGIEAIGQVPNVQAAAERAVAGSAWEQADIAIGGVSSTFADLKQISGEDYTRTVIFMMAGILIILILLLRSIIMPLYLIASLILTYYTSLGVTELIFVDMLGYSGISWPTPFFSFVMLVALGVDYSIFLMDRFNENKHMDAGAAILHAMKNMGTVIISAVIILGGTFASFYPSGVLSMLQIATVVLSGLVLYAILLLPFFVPVMVQLFGSANWWPFRARQADQAKRDRIAM